MPEITKRKVVGRNTGVVGYNADGEPILSNVGFTDYVRPDFLEEYLADARTKWAHVEVSDEPDAGPGGYEGATFIPANLNHPEAGKYFPAEGEAVEGEVQDEPQGERPAVGGGGLVASFLTLQLGLAALALGGLYAIQTAAMKNILSDAYKGAATYGALYTTAPGASAGTEVSGGSPAYARKNFTAGAAWSASSNGVTSATATFDVPSGTTVVGAGVHSAVTAGTYYDGASVTSQAFASQGTYQLTFTYTQT